MRTRCHHVFIPSFFSAQYLVQYLNVPCPEAPDPELIHLSPFHLSPF